MEGFQTLPRVPPSIQRKAEAINERQDQFLKEFMESAPEPLLHQVYPGIAKLKASSGPAQRSLDEEYKWARRVAAFIQHVWSELNLDKYASYPAMNPWMNLIDRWSRTDVVRITWPILRTLLEVEFVRFLEYSTNHRLNQGWSIWLSPAEIHSNYEGDVRFEIHVDPADEGEEKTIWPIGKLERIQLSRQTENLLTVKWHYLDFTIEPGFRGAGLGTRTLRELVNNLLRTTLRVGAKEIQIDVDFSDRSDRPESLSKNSMRRFYQEAEFAPKLKLVGNNEEEVMTYRKKGLNRKVSLCREYGDESRYLPLDLSQSGEHHVYFSLQPKTAANSIVAELRGLSISFEEVEQSDEDPGQDSSVNPQFALVAMWNFRDFITDPAFRRQGWGGHCVSHLLEELQITAGERGLAQTKARVKISGHDSDSVPWPESERREFYRRLGFKHDTASGELEYRRYLYGFVPYAYSPKDDDAFEVRFAELNSGGEFTGVMLGGIPKVGLDPNPQGNGYVAGWSSQGFLVESNHQGHGIGSKCLREAVEYLVGQASDDVQRKAESTGYPIHHPTCLEITVNLSRQDAIPNWNLDDEINFYRQCQFELTSREQDSAQMNLTRFLHPTTL